MSGTAPGRPADGRADGLAGRLARRLPRLAAGAGAIAGFSAAASACPYCALSQDTDTLLYILGFVLMPYAVVSFVVLWIRRLLRQEREEAP